MGFWNKEKDLRGRQVMTVGEILKQYRNIEIELLLAHVLKKPKEFLFAHPESRLTALQYTSVLKLARRRKNGEPAAYLLGYKDFCGLRFTVNRQVLVPRPETEELVQLILDSLWRLDLSLPPRPERRKKGRPETEVSALPKAHGAKLRVLDLGTGSGCIIVSLAKILGRAESPTSPPTPLPDGRGWSQVLSGGQIMMGHENKFRSEFYASDISPAALAVARKNARRHKLKIEFRKSDLFSRLPEKFDLIVANLPYVQINDYKKQKTALRFEPKIALTDGAATWRLYQKFLQQLPLHIADNAKIFLEIDPKSGTLLKRLCRRYFPAAATQTKKDLAGRNRFLVLEF